MSEDNTGLPPERLRQLLEVKLKNLKELEIIGKNSIYVKELSDIALIQLQLQLYDDSEHNYLICLKHFEKQKDRLGQAAVHGVLGTLFFTKGEYQKSIEHNEKAYKFYLDLMQIEEQITCLKGIGSSLVKLNKLDEASEVFIDCSNTCSNACDIYGLLDCLGNLINIYELTGKWDIIFELYKKTLKSFKQINNFKGITTSYFNLGILQKRFNNMEEALRYFKKGTNVAIDSNYAELIIKGLGYVGEVYVYLGDLREAKNQFIKALHIANNIKAENAKKQLVILLKSLGLQQNNIHEELKKYKEEKEKNF